MSRKSFVIDTNVLLHDPDAIKKFKNNDVIIPLVVLEELDTMKRHADEIGKNARHVMRYVDSLKSLGKGDLSGGVTIEEGIMVKIHVDLHPPEKRAYPLPLDRATNQILLAAFILKERGETVVLVSKDFVTRVKAEAIGIQSEDYENRKFSYDRMYRGFRSVAVAKKEIDLFYKDGSISIEAKDFSPMNIV